MTAGRHMATIAGRYEITAKLGEGGMGVVFRAYDPPPLDREVAVKTLHEFTDPLALELFYKECSALKSISHPNIVEIFDMNKLIAEFIGTLTLVLFGCGAAVLGGEHDGNRRTPLDGRFGFFLLPDEEVFVSNFLNHPEQ